MPYDKSLAVDPTAQSNLDQAVNTNPDNEARILDLSRKSGYSPEFIRGREDQIERGLQSPDLYKLQQTAPRTIDFFRDFNNARIAADDGENLGLIERVWKSIAKPITPDDLFIPGYGPAGRLDQVKKAFQKGRKEWDIGEYNVRSGKLYSRKITNILTGNDDPALNEQIKIVDAEEPEPQIDENLLETVTTAAAGMLPLIKDLIISGQATGLEYASFGAATASALSVGPQAFLSPAVIPAAAGTMYAAGVTVGAAGSMYDIESGNALKEFLAITDDNGEPIDPRIAAVAAAAVGAINAGLEYVGARYTPGLEKLVGRISRTSVTNSLKNEAVRASLAEIAQKYAIGVTAETITEMAQEAVTVIFKYLEKNVSEALSGTQFESPEPYIPRILEAGKEALAASLLLSGAGTVITAPMELRKAQASQQYSATLKDFFDGVSQSVLKQRDPATFIRHLNLVGAGQDVFISDTYFQDHPEGIESFRQIGINTEAFMDGMDIAVPLSEIAAKFSPEQLENIRPYIKPAPGAISEADLKNIDLAAELQKVTDVVQDSKEYARERARQVAKIRTQGIKAGMSSAFMRQYTDTLNRFADAYGLNDRQHLAMLKKINIQRGDLAQLQDLERTLKQQKTYEQHQAAMKFKAAFPDTQIADETGTPVAMYRRSRGMHRDIGYFGKGYYLTDNAGTGKGKPFFVDLKNPYVWPESRPPLGIGEGYEKLTAKLEAELAAQGYDGIILDYDYNTPKVTQYSPKNIIVFDPGKLHPVGRFGATEKPTVQIADILYQYPAASEDFYSQLADAVKSDKFPRKTTAANAAKILRSWTYGREGKGGGFLKNDEVEWTGILDWLDKKGGEKVTKEEIAKYLADNSVNIEINDIQDLGPEEPDWYSDETVHENAREIFQEEFNNGVFDRELRNQISEETEKAWNDENHEIWDHLREDKQYYLDGSIDVKKARMDFIEDVEEKFPDMDEYEIKQAWNMPFNYDEIWSQLDKTEEEYRAEYIDEDEAFNDFEGDVKYLNLHEIFGGYVYEIEDEIWENHYEEYIDQSIQAAQEEWLSEHRSGETQYENYTQKGPSENYREILFTWPGSIDTFSSTHWDDIENVMAHTRIDRRIDSNGNKVFFINEIQSDWIAQGRDEGFQGRFKIFLDNELYGEYDDYAEADQEASRLVAEKAGKVELDSSKTSGAPKIPFKTTWRNLVLKKLVRMAAEEDVDYIGWTTGSTQLDIYPSVSKLVDRVSYNAETHVLSYHRTDDTTGKINEIKEVYPRKVKKYIGKDAAKNLLSKEPENGLQTIETKDLVFGGHGLVEMYDRIIPNELKKMFGKKKWGNPRISQGKVELTKRKSEVTIDSVKKARVEAQEANDYQAVIIFDRYIEEHDRGFRNTALTSSIYRNFPVGNDSYSPLYYIEKHRESTTVYTTIWTMPITPQIKQAVAAGEKFPLFQADENQQAPRGAVSMASDQYLISIFEGADLSTLLHETGHIFFRELKSLVDSGMARPDMVADFETIKKWVGFEPGQISFTVAQQEQFARGFEAYLFEGKAPTAELEGAFEKFKRWLRSAYSHINQLGVNLNDEIRGVFDRMMVDTRNIKTSAELSGFKMPSKAHMDALGIVTEDRNYMQRLIDQAYESAEKAMVKARDKDRRIQIKKWRELIQKEIDESPAYNLVADLRSGPGLNRDIMVDEYGQNVVDAMPHGTVRKSGINPADAVGDRFAHVSDAVAALTDLPGKQDYRKHRLQALADEHDSQYLPVDYLATTKEFGAFYEIMAKYHDRDARGVTPQRAFKLYAERRLTSMPVKNAVRQDRYLAAMRKYARMEVDAARRNDFKMAANANEKVRMNYEFAGQAVKVRREVEKITRRTRALMNSKTIDFDYLENIKYLAMRFGLPFIAPMDMAKRKTIESLMRGADDDLFDNSGAFSDWILNETISKPYKEITVDQIRELWDAFQFLAARGRDIKEGKLHTYDMKIADAASKIAAEMSDLRSKKIWDRLGFMRKMTDVSRGYFAAMDSLPFVIMSMGGYQDIGPNGVRGFSQVVISDALIDAQDKESAQLADMFHLMYPHMLQLQKAVRRMRKRYGNKIMLPDAVVPELFIRDGRDYITPDQILAIALNMGNQGNIKRLYAGYEGLDETTVQAWLNLLDKNDWDAVQGIWNTIGKLFTEIDRVHRIINGFPVKKVEPVPVKTRFGEYPGGYYPIKYDFDLPGAESYKAATFAEKEDLLAMQSSEAIRQVPSVKSNMTKQRAASARMPLKLSTMVAPQHIKETVHYINFALALRDADRLTRHPLVQDQVERHLGVDVYRKIRPALKYIARPSRESLGGFDKYFEWLRARTTAFILGTNASVAIKQIFSIPGAINDIGFKNFVGGLDVFFTASPMQCFEEIKAMSPYMAARSDAFDRELMRQFYLMDPNQRALWWGDSAYTAEDIRNFAFIPIRIMDTLAVMPIWNGAYKKAMRELDSHDKAVKYADEAVRKSQPSSQPYDLTDWQRRPGIARLFSMFQTFTVGKYRQRMRYNFRAWRNGKMTSVQYGRYLILDALLPPIAMSILFSVLHGEDPEDDDLFKNIGAETLRYTLLTGLPFIDSLFSDYGGPLDTTVSAAPDEMQRAIRLGYRYITDQNEEDLSKIAWSVGHLTSFALGLPVSQIARKAVKGSQEEDRGPLKYILPAQKRK